MRFLILALFGFILAACASTPPPTGPAQVMGNVHYLERIALPRPGQVRVTLQDVSRADAPADILAEQVIDITTDAGPPFPFVLNYDRASIVETGRYIVRAEIRDAGGDLRFTTVDAYPVLTNGAPSEIDVTVRMVQQQQQTSSAPLPRPASGGHSEELRAQGIDFRAVGNEPGWILDLYADRADLTYDYGNENVQAPLPAPAYPVEGQTRYDLRAGAEAMTIIIRRFPCQDVMSGEPFPATVTVQLGSRTLQGCGRSV